MKPGPSYQSRPKDLEHHRLLGLLDVFVLVRQLVFFSIPPISFGALPVFALASVKVLPDCHSHSAYVVSLYCHLPVVFALYHESHLCPGSFSDDLSHLLGHATSFVHVVISPGDSIDSCHGLCIDLSTDHGGDGSLDYGSDSAMSTHQCQPLASCLIGNIPQGSLYDSYDGNSGLHLCGSARSSHHHDDFAWKWCCQVVSVGIRGEA